MKAPRGGEAPGGKGEGLLILGRVPFVILHYFLIAIINDLGPGPGDALIPGIYRLRPLGVGWPLRPAFDAFNPTGVRVGSGYINNAPAKGTGQYLLFGWLLFVAMVA